MTIDRVTRRYDNRMRRVLDGTKQNLQTIESDITVIEGDVTLLDGRVTTLEGSGVGGLDAAQIALGSGPSFDYVVLDPDDLGYSLGYRMLRIVSSGSGTATVSATFRVPNGSAYTTATSTTVGSVLEAVAGEYSGAWVWYILSYAGFSLS